MSLGASCVAILLVGAAPSSPAREALVGHCEGLFGRGQCHWADNVAMLTGQAAGQAAGRGAAGASACWDVTLVLEPGGASADVALKTRAQPPKEVHRALHFRPQDAEKDRWATLGLVVAAMVTVEERALAEARGRQGPDDAAKTAAVLSAEHEGSTGGGGTSTVAAPIAAQSAVAQSAVAQSAVAPSVVAPSVVAPSAVAPSVVAPSVVAPSVVAPSARFSASSLSSPAQDDARARLPAPADGARPRFGLGLAGATTVGPLPGWAWGARVELTLAGTIGNAHLAVALRGGFFPARSEATGAPTSTSSGAAGGRFGMASAGLGLCAFLPFAERWRLRPCGGVELAWVRATGFGVAETKTETVALGDAWLTAPLQRALGAHLFVFLGPGLSVLFSRPTFAIRNDGAVFRPSRLGGTFELGLGGEL